MSDDELVAAVRRLLRVLPVAAFASEPAASVLATLRELVAQYPAELPANAYGDTFPVGELGERVDTAELRGYARGVDSMARQFAGLPPDDDDVARGWRK